MRDYQEGLDTQVRREIQTLAKHTGNDILAYELTEPHWAENLLERLWETNEQIAKYIEHLTGEAYTIVSAAADYEHPYAHDLLMHGLLGYVRLLEKNGVACTVSEQARRQVQEQVASDDSHDTWIRSIDHAMREQPAPLQDAYAFAFRVSENLDHEDPDIAALYCYGVFGVYAMFTQERGQTTN